MKLLILIICLTFNTTIFAKEYKIATWNIVGGKKLFSKKSNYSNIENVIRKGDLKNSDFISFTEQGDPDQVAQIAHRLGYYYSEGIWGNSILSKYKIVNTGSVVVNPVSMRQAAWADIEIENNEIIRVYAVHLSYKMKLNPFIPKIRGKEMELVLINASTFKGKVIIAGDFNTVRMIPIFMSNKPVLKNAKKYGYKNAFKKKRKLTQIMGQLDWIFARGVKKIVKSKIGKFSGSDHRYIYTSIEF